MGRSGLTLFRIPQCALSITDVPAGRYSISWLVNSFECRPTLADAVKGDHDLRRAQAQPSDTQTIDPMDMRGHHAPRADCVCPICIDTPYYGSNPSLVKGTTRFYPAGNPLEWPHDPTSSTPTQPGYAMDVNFDVWTTFEHGRHGTTSPGFLKDRIILDWSKVGQWLGPEEYGGWKVMQSTFELPLRNAHFFNIHLYIWWRSAAWKSGLRFGGAKIERLED